MFTNFLLAAAALAGSSAGSAPHVLTTAELRAHLIGFTISRAGLTKEKAHLDSAEQFDPNGIYVRYDDNYEAHGTYSIRNSEVCVRAEEEAETCRFIMVDSTGTYWIVKSMIPPVYKNIKFTRTER